MEIYCFIAYIKNGIIPSYKLLALLAKKEVLMSESRMKALALLVLFQLHFLADLRHLF